MAKKRTEPTPKEAARAAAPKPEPCCYESGCCLDAARAALGMAQTLPDIAAVLYGLEPAERGKLHAEVAAARNRVLGVA